jgi:hypothetical protein
VLRSGIVPHPLGTGVRHAARCVANAGQPATCVVLGLHPQNELVFHRLGPMATDQASKSAPGPQHDFRRIAESIINLYESATDIQVADDQSTELLVLHGICSQAVNQARAALKLIDAGYAREAVANVRVALEHAVTAQWGHYVPEMHGRLLEGAKRQAADFYSAAGEYLGATDFEGKVEEWGKCKGLPKFRQIMERVDGSRSVGQGFLRFNYALLSRQVHVTSGAVSSYLSFGDQNITLNRSATDPNAQGTMFALAMAVALSVYVVEDLRTDKSRRNQVDRLAEDVVPCTLEQDIAQASHQHKHQ